MIQRHKVTAHFQMIGINKDTDRDHTSLTDSNQPSVQILRKKGATSPQTFRPTRLVQDTQQKIF